jgi:hypothetical protein
MASSGDCVEDPDSSPSNVTAICADGTDSHSEFGWRAALYLLKAANVQKRPLTRRGRRANRPETVAGYAHKL